MSERLLARPGRALSPAIQIRLLGVVELTGRTRRVVLDDPLQRGVLTVLAGQANSPVRSETVAASLWAVPPPSALSQMRTTIAQLQKKIDDVFAFDEARHRPRLLDRPSGHLLLAAPQSVDLHIFERRMHVARGYAGTGDFVRADQYFRGALSMWRDRPAAEGTGRSSSSATGRPDVTDHRARWIGAVEERMANDLVLGRHQQVIDESPGLIDAFPHREGLRLHLIRALSRAGRRAEAAEVYLFSGEASGIRPSEELTAAYHVAMVGLRQAAPNPSPSSSHAAPTPAPSPRPDGDVPTVLDTPPPHLVPIMEVLLSGATDLAASKRLGLSPRTFSRRVSELLEQLGADSRFQAGVRAYQRGWIVGPYPAGRILPVP